MYWLGAIWGSKITITIVILIILGIALILKRVKKKE